MILIECLSVSKADRTTSSMSTEARAKCLTLSKSSDLYPGPVLAKYYKASPPPYSDPEKNASTSRILLQPAQDASSETALTLIALPGLGLCLLVWNRKMRQTWTI